MSEIILNKITSYREEQCKFIYGLSNEDTARQNSINQNSFSFETHKAWYRKKIASINDYIFLASLGKEFIGFVRFDFNEIKNNFIISISLHQKFRGRGLASRLIDLGLEKINLLASEYNEIQAFVLETNKPSSKAFLKSGFTLNRYQIINDRKFNIYTC